MTVDDVVDVLLSQTGDGSSDNSLVAVARLRVHVQDVNDKSPQFQGVDVNGNYPAAVSDYTTEGDEVIYVSAIDVDADEPNNVVSGFIARPW